MESQLVYAIIVCTLQILFIAFTVHYCTEIYKSRNQYPLKQLSPILTLFLGGFYQLFATILIFVDIINNFYNEFFIENTNIKRKEYNQAQVTLILIVSFFQLWARGCCYTLQLFKLARVSIALNKKELQPNQLIVRFFSNEIYLLYVSLFQGFLFFPFITYIQCLLQNIPIMQAMLVYQQHQNIVGASIFSQELLTIIIMGVIQTKSIQDNLFKLTLYPQFLYIIWYSLNTIIPIDNKYIQLSFWFRCQFMVGLFVVLPTYFVELLPNIYITTKQIAQVDFIMAKKFNSYYKDNQILIAFYNFLIYKDAHTEPQFYLNNYFNQQLVYHPNKNYFQNLLDLLNLVDKTIQHCSNNYILTDEFFILNQKFNFFQNYQDLFQVKSGLLKMIRSIYCQEFKKTVAFDVLYKAYKQNEIVKSNLECLNISLQEFEFSDENQLESLIL